MTDEKLNECSAASHGIYIKGIMCLMHKSEQYGKILLKQKDQQTDNKLRNFAVKIKKHTPYTVEEIEAALFELLAEKVLYIEGDSLCQKRMIEDNHISQVRSEAGKTSAEVKKTNKKKVKKFVGTKASTNGTTKPPTNTEYESEVESESGFKYEFKESAEFEKPDFPGEDIIFPIDTPVVRELWSRWKQYRWGEHKLRYGMMGEQAALKQLEGMDYPRIEGAIMKAIEAGWQNLYPEKNGRANNPKSTNKKQQQTSDTGDYLKNHYAAKRGGTAEGSQN